MTVLTDDAAVLAAASAFAPTLRAGAEERDSTAALPYRELEQLAATGLLGMRVPAELGGAGVSTATVAEVFRVLSAADPAVGQIPQNHVAFVDLVLRAGTPAQREFFAAEFLAGARLGNALSERGTKTSRAYGTRILPRGEDVVVNGTKYYSTGALTAQWIPVFGLDELDEVSVAYVRRDTPGVVVEQDWNAFGQRATFSGTTRLTDVVVPAEHVLRRPFRVVAGTTFSAFGQIIHAAIEVGIARGALTDGVAFLRDKARPAHGSGYERAVDDPHLVRLAGELEIDVRAAEALLVSAARAVDAADDDPGLVTHARLEVAAAKAFAGRVALDVATRLFDFSGSSAADRKHDLDRHWRNARTHTLHDPARLKELALGTFLVTGEGPDPANTLI
ncbi:SfnB family sulfur acquisition oxidoreductase [Cryptosporangium arvum]|uniref:SfnB family sulfur acquisition oxidoreductase n=1 Tax=Cryptosporangium arvum TaxID=80871 RepID=UPI0004B429A4|nr:SfnB family sulfur acquisition oxidoreductase [Cryptosporangium arvum]